jgi:NADH:ubiquinone oxidoreductase subunit 4 (subunit M)
MNVFMLSAVVVISLSAGMAVYRFGLFWFLSQPLRLREWSLYLPFYLAFGVAVTLVYLPVFWWLRERLKETRPLLVFPLAGALLSMVPIYGLRVSGEPRLANATSSEALMIYSMFVTSGFVFGLFYPGLCREGDENEI